MGLLVETFGDYIDPAENRACKLANSEESLRGARLGEKRWDDIYLRSLACDIPL